MKSLMQEQLQRHCSRGTCSPLIFSELGRNAAALGAARLLCDDIIASMEFKEKDVPITE